MISSYHTLREPTTAEFKDKGSRFIAFAYPVVTADEVKICVDELKQQHHKARHWCYAYRLGVDGNQFRANDDGEPAGSAGRPILGQIDSAGLTDTLVVVVRYFGGTLLGIPGLIHAYKTVTAKVLQEAVIIEKAIYKTVCLHCSYAGLNEVLRIVKQHQAKVISQEWQLDCQLIIHVPLQNHQLAIASWEKIKCVKLVE